MELRHLRYFLAVAEELNFTRAAARVGIGQPPLSQQIRDLEAEIGTPLFHRLPHGAELTAAGDAFLEAVRRIPDQVATAVRAAQRAGRGEIGALRVGFTSSAAMNPVVASSIRRFRDAYPGVDLSLQESNTTALLTGLRDGSIDVAFLRPGGEPMEDIASRTLPDEPMVLAVPLGHPALNRTERGCIPLGDLSADPMLLTPRAMGPSLYDAAINACHQAGFEPKLGQSAPQIASVLSLVAAAAGVSIVPASMQQLALQGVAYRGIADVKASAALAIAHARVSRSTPVRNFVATVISVSQTSSAKERPTAERPVRFVE